MDPIPAYQTSLFELYSSITLRGVCWGLRGFAGVCGGLRGFAGVCGVHAKHAPARLMLEY